MKPVVRPPLITGKTTQEQIHEIVSYLRQLSVTLSRLAEMLPEQEKNDSQ